MLVKLLQTGTCDIPLNESVFDLDHPGHYFRRLRSVAVSIPCVAGPYTSVNATLTLVEAVVRTVAPSTGYQSCAWPNPTGPGVISSPTSGAPPVIATSGGQNDAGLFEVNLRDERWLPFEGQGAISKWTLTLDRRDNSFDVNSVSDIILHLRYTARLGDAGTVRAAIKPAEPRSILISAGSAFSDAYYRFFNPSDTSAAAQTLILPLTSSVFPFSNLGAPNLIDVTVVIVLAQPLAQDTASALGGLPWQFGPSSSLTPANVTFTQVPTPSPPAVVTANALQSGQIAATVAPGEFKLTLPLKDAAGKSTLPDGLTATVNGQTLDPKLISDIVLVVRYKLS